MLYIGVRFGSIISTLGVAFKDAAYGDDEAVRKSPEYDFILAKYWEIVDEAESVVDDGLLDELDETIEKKLRLK